MVQNQNEEMDEEIRPAEEQEIVVSSSESDDSPILAREPKKRRRSSYLDFIRVARTFPNVDTRVLCQLAELVDVRPSAVLDLVPEASATQIGAFMRIAEDSINKERWRPT